MKKETRGTGEARFELRSAMKGSSGALHLRLELSMLFNGGLCNRGVLWEVLGKVWVRSSRRTSLWTALHLLLHLICHLVCF